MSVKKSTLDKKVAILLHLNKDQVSSITSAFLREVHNALVDQGEVQLDGLGKMRVVKSTPQRPQNLIPPKHGQLPLPEMHSAQLRVHFSKADSLRRALRQKRGGVERRKAG